MAKSGLYANIHAKRKRIAAGSKEKMRRPGTKGAPTAKQFKQAAKTAKKPKTVMKAFAGGVIPDPSMAIAMAQQASPQDYVNYKMSGETQSKVAPAEQKYDAVKPEVAEVQAEEKNEGGLVFTKSIQKDYYKDLL
jgi:hypothetical protein